MSDLPDELIYSGISVDILFEEKPTFGDLYLICGTPHPNFPPTSSIGLEKLESLQFEQVDDFFGVRSTTDEGNDVAMWLYPLIDGEPVHHHAGPFDGVRLQYSILRNPIRRAQHFLKCVEMFSAFAKMVFYASRNTELGLPPDLSKIQSDIDSVSNFWLAQGITVGSDEALEVDF